MIWQMAITKALLGFNETDFIYNYLYIVQNWTKNQRGKLEKF